LDEVDWKETQHRRLKFLEANVQ